MKFNRFSHSEKMSTSASAPCTNAYSFCAHSADTAMISVLDAIIMASIIIYGLAILLNLRLIALLVILAAIVGLVRLVHCKTDTPWCYELAV